jgi:hypothetical protein
VRPNGHHCGDALPDGRSVGSAPSVSVAMRFAPTVTRILSQFRAAMAVVAVWRYAETTGSGDGCN